MSPALQDRTSTSSCCTLQCPETAEAAWAALAAGMGMAGLGMGVERCPLPLACLFNLGFLAELGRRRAIRPLVLGSSHLRLLRRARRPGGERCGIESGDQRREDLVKVARARRGGDGQHRNKNQRAHN